MSKRWVVNEYDCSLPLFYHPELSNRHFDNVNNFLLEPCQPPVVPSLQMAYPVSIKIHDLQQIFHVFPSKVKL